MFNILLKIWMYSSFYAMIISEGTGFALTIKSAFSNRPDWIIRDGKHEYPFGVEWGNVLISVFYILAMLCALEYNILKGVIS